MAAEYYYTVMLQEGFSPLVETVHGAYLEEQGSFTYFRGSDDLMVAMYRTELLVSVKRGSLYGDDRA